jgi:hypothetical protein
MIDTVLLSLIFAMVFHRWACWSMEVWEIAPPDWWPWGKRP